MFCQAFSVTKGVGSHLLSAERRFGFNYPLLALSRLVAEWWKMQREISSDIGVEVVSAPPGSVFHAHTDHDEDCIVLLRATLDLRHRSP